MSSHPRIIDRFEAVAADQPDNPAVVTGAQDRRGGEQPVTSYRALAELVSWLADWLAGEVGRGEVVATSLRKSPAALAVMLASMRAGIAYVPIDPGAPAPRRREILDDCLPRLVFLDSDSARDWNGEGFDDLAAWPWPTRGRPSALDGVAIARRHLAADDAAADLAYVLYTSGSTGRPKGVMTTEANAGFFVDWTSRAFPLGPGDRVAQHAPLHFDLPVYDVYTSLTSGAAVHLMDERTVLFPAAAHAFLRDHAITSMYAVPSALTSLLGRSALRTEGLPRLRQLLYAGEEFHVPRLRELVAALPSDARVANLYGPVETNVITWQDVDHAILAGDRVPIGRPAPQTRIRLRDDAGSLHDYAPGNEGEIVVAGPSVSPGYLRDPDRTAATRLTIDGATGPTRYYRTGDFGRVDAAGRLCFRGRRDGMVKTRGFRVELGDVEAALAAHTAVVQAVVSPVPHARLGTVLQAHVLVEEGAPVSDRDLQRWVGARLPAYMVPAAVHLCTSLPTTSTGKVARAELAGGAR